ncbi:TPA: hypothetical protein ACTXAA_003047 [Raoultella planticola]
MQALRLARGNEVTVLDTVYRAHPVTGELVTRWKKAAKRKK